METAIIISKFGPQWRCGDSPGKWLVPDSQDSESEMNGKRLWLSKDSYRSKAAATKNAAQLVTKLKKEKMAAAPPRSDGKDATCARERARNVKTAVDADKARIASTLKSMPQSANS